MKRQIEVLIILVCCVVFDCCTSLIIDDGATSVVLKYLEALKNNDSKTISSLRWIAEKDNDFILPDQNLGVIDLMIDSVNISMEETKKIRKRYSKSDLAKKYGWTENYVNENMIAVFAKYAVDFDNNIVPNDGGDISQYFYLIRDKKNMSWLIWSESFDVNNN